MSDANREAFEKALIALCKASEDFAISPDSVTEDKAANAWNEVMALFDTAASPVSTAADAKDAAKWRAINIPETADFIRGVELEAAHQVQKWGAAHDRNKSAENWFWLVGYLTGKCLRACLGDDPEKAKHHTISSAAALLNWHAAISRGSSVKSMRMRIFGQLKLHGSNAPSPPCLTKRGRYE